VAMSAFALGPAGPAGSGGVPRSAAGGVSGGGRDDGSGAARREAALAEARREAATLREVFGAIQDAFVAAAARLEALEAQLDWAPDHDGPPPTPPLRPARPGAGWTLSGWTPAAGGEVVNGETLRARREALGVSQAAVAHAAHCSRGLVAEVERGKRCSAPTLAHLAAALDRLEQQARRK
jgi:hypothetical protein